MANRWSKIPIVVSVMLGALGIGLVVSLYFWPYRGAQTASVPDEPAVVSFLVDPGLAGRMNAESPQLTMIDENGHEALVVVWRVTGTEVSLSQVAKMKPALYTI
jgi:hypothetical protein